MNLILKINTVDRSSLVHFGSVKKQDNLNQQVDILQFNIKYHPGQTFKPAVNDNIELYDGLEKIFAGVIITVTSIANQSGEILYEVKCKDLSHFFDRLIVTDRYTDTNIQAIITDLLASYAPTFTGVNVVAIGVDVKSVSFNGITLSSAINKLANMINYSWYVDYNYDLHFFAKNQELAPFNLSDTSANYIFDSLELTDDISQMRNSVLIEGGEYEGNSRVDYLSGTGSQTSFPLPYKYASIPTVSVGGVPKIVGVDGLTPEADADVFWSYQQKYLRFKSTTIPANAQNNIAITGIPLYRIKVRVKNGVAIGIYGEYQFFERNDSIRSREEAIDFGLAKLQAYADKIVEGSFETYTPGLRSGQAITIQSTIRGINEEVLIQSVRMTQTTVSRATYEVEFATLRTMGIITFLQNLLKREVIDEGIDTVLLSFIDFADLAKATDSVTALAPTTAPYRWGAQQFSTYASLSADKGFNTYDTAGTNTFGDLFVVTGGPNVMRWNLFTWS